MPIVANEFAARRDRLNMNQDEIAAEAGVNRDTVSAVEHGRGSAPSRRKIDEALTRLEAESGKGPIAADEPPAPAPEELHLIEYEVTGNFGVRFVVKGRIEDAREMEESIARLVRNVNAEQQRD